MRAMPLLDVEGLRGTVRQIIPKIGIEPPGEDAILDFVNSRLKQPDRMRAENIASQVREKIGIYRFGPMWAEWYGSLPKGGTVDLQSSEDTLVASVHPAAACLLSIDMSWNRRLEMLNWLGFRYPQNHKWLWYYRDSGAQPGLPYPSSNAHVLRTFAIVLDKIEQSITATSLL